MRLRLALAAALILFVIVPASVEDPKMYFLALWVIAAYGFLAWLAFRILRWFLRPLSGSPDAAAPPPSPPPHPLDKLGEEYAVLREKIDKLPLDEIEREEIERALKDQLLSKIRDGVR